MSRVKQQRIAVIGYGSQGQALALNWRDSGRELVVGLRARSKSRATARRDRMGEIASIADAVAAADIVCFAFPDYLHGRVYSQSIARHLRTGATLLFLHGMSVHFGMVTLPEHCDAVLLAPHAPGVAVREKFLGDRTVSAFWGVEQNASGKAADTVRRLARDAGFKPSRLIETTFQAEAVGDIFGEQAVLCGGLAMLLKYGFETLLERGWPAENAYLEVGYQLDLIVELIKKHGLDGMFDRISVTARHGSAEAGPKIIGPAVKRQMGRVFNRIDSGKFTRELADLDSDDLRRLKQRLRLLSHPKLDRAARKVAGRKR